MVLFKEVATIAELKTQLRFARKRRRLCFDLFRDPKAGSILYDEFGVKPSPQSTISCFIGFKDWCQEVYIIREELKKRNDRNR